jgi:hypothetical protein
MNTNMDINIELFSNPIEIGEFSFVVGAMGVKGDKGDTATVAIGTVTTGTPTTPAAVTNVGTDTDPIFNIVIPKGDKGDQGIQ